MQAVYRKVEEHDFQQHYTSIHELPLKIRMIPAIAFVPVADVPATLEMFMMILQRMCDLFLGSAGQRDPSFLYYTWNVVSEWMRFYHVPTTTV